MKELTVEQYYTKRVEEEFPGSQTHKYEIRRSEPDRITLIPGGIAVFVELKKPTKEPRPEQYRAIDRLQKLGFFVAWTDTKQGVDEILVSMRDYVKSKSEYKL